MRRRIAIIVILCFLFPVLPPISAQASGSLNPTGAMTRARACHTATLLQDGTVLVAGGIPGDGRINSDADIYNPTTGAFTPVGELNRPRACHGAALLRNGLVLIIGGVNRRGRMSTAEVYDPITKEFTYIGDMTTIRSGFTATVLKDGRVLITGGYGTGILQSAEIFDPATFTFTNIGMMTISRYNHTATLLQDGRVLIVGGQVRARGNNQIFATAEIYDPATNRFTVTGSMSVARQKHAAALLPDGNVLITGGADERDWNGVYASAEIYDVKTGVFIPAGSMWSTRFRNADAVVILPNGQPLISYGARNLELYNPQTGAFELLNGSFDTDRFYGTATVLGNGTVLIVGGYDYNIEATTQAWIFRP
ncbi:MAG TPA: kelch repeat-containing protein [Aggregatilineales bacterium]|nr:hypothetical protein [Anaerolineales bacterium]HRE46943.1 kelch repeat-containing protein [Aggregatilineales bacterium]